MSTSEKLNMLQQAQKRPALPSREDGPPLRITDRLGALPLPVPQLKL